MSGPTPASTPAGWQPIARQQALPPSGEPRTFVNYLAAAVWALGGHGWHWWIFAVIALPWLLAPAVALSTKIHDVRVHQLNAAGGVIGVVMALLSLLCGGGLPALLAGVLSGWVFVTAGRIAIRYEPRYEGAEAPEARPAVDAKVATDEALLAYFVGVAKIPGGAEAEAMCVEALRLDAVLKDQGWATNPERYHAKPVVPAAAAVDARQYRGVAYERVRYPSNFVPQPELPGAAAWQAQINNSESVLRVFRHPGAPRPWLLCIHGYRMGHNWLDFGLFPPRVLHQKLGYNLLMPTLPLHGSRKSGGSSGDGYLDGNLLTLLHAQTQALWDLRCALAWLRDREPGAKIGAYGVSLGGYNAALLATVEPELAFVLAGIPLADVAGTLWRHLPDIHQRFYAQHGLTVQCYREILNVVSPLARPALLPSNRLHVFAATADRIVIPDQPLLLARHWGTDVRWYQGSHLSIRHERTTRLALKDALSSAGWQ